jgi:hypothetical protein
MSLGRLDLRRSLEVEDDKRKLKQPVTPRSESPSPREGHLHLWCRILELGIRLAVQTHDSGFLNPVNLALGSRDGPTCVQVVRATVFDVPQIPKDGGGGRRRRGVRPWSCASSESSAKEWESGSISKVKA